MTEIDYSSFQTILCLNGEIPPKSFFDQFQHASIIAADGACMTLLQQGIIPNLVIGDFDSLTAHYIDKNTDQNIQYIKISDQNSTDFEKCIFEMQRKSLFPALVCGAFGKEIDHTIYNMHCLMKYGSEFPMVLYDHTIKENPKWCIPIYKKLTLKVIPEKIISLLPYPNATLTTKGLKWNLKNTSLSVNGVSSPRNQSVSANIEILVNEGQVMLITSGKEFTTNNPNLGYLVN